MFSVVSAICVAVCGGINLIIDIRKLEMVCAGRGAHIVGTAMHTKLCS